MPITEVEDFRKKYGKFLKWLPYMATRRNKVDPQTPLWKTVLKDFYAKVADPVDEAWAKLTDEEKRLFRTG